MAKINQKLSYFLRDNSLSSTTIEQQKEGGYKVVHFYFDKKGNRRIKSFFVQNIIDDIGMKENRHMPSAIGFATKFFSYQGKNGYYINLYTS